MSRVSLQWCFHHRDGKPTVTVFATLSGSVQITRLPRKACANVFTTEDVAVSSTETTGASNAQLRLPDCFASLNMRLQEKVDKLDGYGT